MDEGIKEIKEKAAENWQKAFPQLTAYTRNKYHKIVGPIITGLELVKLPRSEAYRPHFVCYPLWKHNLKACLDTPIILKEFYNKKGLQFSIPYTKHTTLFSDVLSAVKKQTPIPLEGDVPLKTLFFALDEHSKTPPLSAASNSYLQAILQESKLEIALWIGNSDQVQSIFSQIQKRNWDESHFAMWKVDVNQWLKRIQGKVNGREKLVSQVRLNKQDKKLEKLQQSELKA